MTITAPKWINLTAHALNIEGIGVLPPSGIIARCETVRTHLPNLSRTYGVRLIDQDYGEVTGIPEVVPGTEYIVSSLVLNGLKDMGVHRDDVWAPDTGPDAIRTRGVVTMVRGLVR